MEIPMLLTCILELPLQLILTSSKLFDHNIGLNPTHAGYKLC